MAYANLPQMFFTRAEELAGRPRYRFREGETWREVTWAEMADRVRRIAAALVDSGVAPGDRVALLSNTRREWPEIDLGILAAGAVTIPIYQSSVPAECGYILANSSASVAFVENEKQRQKVQSVATEGFELDGVMHRVQLRRLVQIEGEPGDAEPLAALLDRGGAALPRLAAEIDRRIGALDRGTLATIVYTSGTTGPPKGVPQTHGNHLAMIESVLRLGVLAEGQVDFFFLPLAHSFARLIEYLGIAGGTITAFARSIDTLAEDMAAAKPHIIPAVPRVYEKVYARIMAVRDSGNAVRRALFDWAVSVGKARSRLEQAKQPIPFLLQVQNAIAQRLVFSRIHQVVGGNVRFMISGAAPLAREILEFFHAAGLLILEGYGLTETTPALTINRPDRFKFGTVGLPLDCCEVRLAPDGEILARGANVASGYYNRPEATAEAWDAEGWFHTGDIGEFDAEGFLRITDRKKDLIKTSGGKYVAPQKIENLLKLQPHVSQGVVIGDNRKYCVALITLDAEEVRRWGASQGLTFADTAAMASHPAVQKLIEEEVAAVNKTLASWETIKYFRILPGDFSPESGELTPSLKVKRKVVTERYRDVIEEMYS